MSFERREEGSQHLMSAGDGNVGSCRRFRDGNQGVHQDPPRTSRRVSQLAEAAVTFVVMSE